VWISLVPALLNPWLIACRSRELSAAAPLAVTAEGRALVLFRDAAGAPAALEDRCAHRNTPLSIGTVKNGLLHCAYHGWSYGADGSVREVPALPAGAVCAHAVPRYHATEQDGFVWIALDATAPPAPPPAFAHLNEPGWSSFVMKTRFNAGVDACLENFLDCPHATFVHRYLFRAPTARPVRAVVRTLDNGAEAEFFEEPREKSLVWWLLAPRGGGMQHTDRYIAPRTSRVDYVFPGGLHYIITSSCTAISGAETEVYTVITFRYGRVGWLIKLFFEPLSRRIIRQDVDILNAQGRNLARFGGMGGTRFHDTAADLLGPHIRAWRKAMDDGSAPPAAGQQQHADIRL
jgi:phenylpropionate dioxygenase-like ring-hydroxylating dioxygenase large terminal subunit